MVKSFWGRSRQLLICRVLAHFGCCLTQRLSLIRRSEGTSSHSISSILPLSRILSLSACHSFSLSIQPIISVLIIGVDVILNGVCFLSIIGLIRKPTSFVSETSRTGYLCGK